MATSNSPLQHISIYIPYSFKQESGAIHTLQIPALALHHLPFQKRKRTRKRICRNTTSSSMALPNATSDVLIIGGGPAGLSAALACSRQLCKAIVFDSGVYRNDMAHHMHTLPTWDHQDPKKYRAAARKELTERYKTTRFVDRKVDKLSQRSDGLFEASDAQGESHTGKKVILASGVQDIYPDIPGYGDCWGRSM